MADITQMLEWLRRIHYPNAAPPTTPPFVPSGPVSQAARAEEQRKRGFRGFMDRLTSPEAVAFLATMARGMTRPRQFGETGLGQGVAALTQGMGAAYMQRELARQRQAEQLKALMEYQQAQLNALKTLSDAMTAARQAQIGERNVATQEKLVEPQSERMRAEAEAARAAAAQRQASIAQESRKLDIMERYDRQKLEIDRINAAANMEQAKAAMKNAATRAAEANNELRVQLGRLQEARRANRAQETIDSIRARAYDALARAQAAQANAAAAALKEKSLRGEEITDQDLLEVRTKLMGAAFGSALIDPTNQKEIEDLARAVLKMSDEVVEPFTKRKPK